MRIARTVVLVTDQDRALAFYRDALGFRVLHDDEEAGMRYLHVGPEGDEAGLWLFPVRVGRPPGEQPLLVLHVDELDAVKGRLTRYGTAIFNERDDATGRSFQFRDADGHIIVAAERGR